MQLSRVVETSNRVAATTKRLEKSELIAALLRQLQPDAIEIAVSFLSGVTRQGRIGIGYSTLGGGAVSPASAPTLELLEVDRAFESLKTTRGSGSAGRKLDLLKAIFSRATAEEQLFLAGLLGGEIRQGALEGVMLDALARATGVALDRVRRAAMMAGSIAPVTALQPTSGGIAPAAPPMTMFCGVERFSHIV